MQGAERSSGSPYSPLDHYYSIHRQLEGDIQATNSQIHSLNSRIIKSNYDQTQIIKLQQRHQALLQKQRELEQAIKNQQYMQKELEMRKSNDNSFKHSLANQYIQLAEEKRRKAEEQKRRAVEQERMVQEYNRKAIEEDYLRKKQVMEEQKKAALEEITMRQQLKLKEKEEREREKEEFNQKVLLRSQLQTQKDSVYKQYYQQFMENQDTLQNIYKNKAAISERDKQAHRSQFQQKQLQQFQQKVAKEQQERLLRMNQQKDMLKSFLQNQIQEKQRRKSREREEELNYQAQVSRYQVNAAEIEQMERNKRKQDQHRYDQELKVQTRSRIYSSGQAYEARKSHNPITNPIDFKIGITNPYLIREYEKEKQRQLGQNQLKLRNLALLGNATLHHH